MLNAHCWRYMRDPNYDFCFPAGIILDEFEKILTYVRKRTLKKDMEPEITTTLFHLGETFYDHFDFKIENYFHQTSDVKVKITSETHRQSFLPNVYNIVSNVTKETLLRDIHKCMRKNRGKDKEGTSSQNFSADPHIIDGIQKKLKLDDVGKISNKC